MDEVFGVVSRAQKMTTEVGIQEATPLEVALHQITVTQNEALMQLALQLDYAIDEIASLKQEVQVLRYGF